MAIAAKSAKYSSTIANIAAGTDCERFMSVALESNKALGKSTSIVNALLASRLLAENLAPSGVGVFSLQGLCVFIAP